MIETLRIAAGVATPLGLLGFFLALGYLVKYRQLKHQEALVRSLPEAERAKTVDEYLSRYRLDASNLTRDQKCDLLLREMKKKYELARLKIITSASVFVVCFAIATYAYLQISLFRSDNAAAKPNIINQATKTNGDGSPAINNAGASAGRDIIINVNPTPNSKPDAGMTKSVLVIYRTDESFTTSSIAKFGLNEENYNDRTFNVSRFQHGVLAALRANGIGVPDVAFRAFSFDRKTWLTDDIQIMQIRGVSRVVLVEKDAVTAEHDLDFFWTIASSSPAFQ